MFDRIKKRFLKNKQKDIDAILSGGGGLLKRVDEHRELVELLARECPEFLEKNWWVKHWLTSQDMFLCSLFELAENHNRWRYWKLRPFPLEELEPDEKQRWYLEWKEPDWLRCGFDIPTWVDGKSIQEFFQVLRLRQIQRS